MVYRYAGINKYISRTTIELVIIIGVSLIFANRIYVCMLKWSACER